MNIQRLTVTRLEAVTLDVTSIERDDLPVFVITAVDATATNGHTTVTRRMQPNAVNIGDVLLVDIDPAELKPGPPPADTPA